MTILWGISILLCMSFPVSSGQNVRLDLRVIPLLLGILYGGFWSGIFLSVLIILYRLYFGIDIGFYNTIFSLLFSVPVILFFQKIFMRSKKDKRIKVAAVLSFYHCLVGLIFFNILRGFSIEYTKVQIVHLIFAVIVTWIFIRLNETIREIYQLRLKVQNAEKLRVVSKLTSVLRMKLETCCKLFAVFCSF